MNENKRRRIRGVLRSYTSPFRPATATPQVCLAAAVVLKAVEALWYGTGPTADNNRWKTHRRAVLDITNGGIDLWLQVLGMPVEETIDTFMQLIPETVELRYALENSA